MIRLILHKADRDSEHNFYVLPVERPYWHITSLEGYVTSTEVEDNADFEKEFRDLIINLETYIAENKWM